MVDILKVTTPLPGQEIGKVRPYSPAESNGPNIVDPSRVTKPNSQNVYSDKKNNQFSPNLASNYEKFLQMIRNTPDVSESYGQIFFSRLGSIVSSGMGEDIAEELAKYMEMLKMTEGDLLSLLKSNQGAAVKFNGAFFDILRGVLKGNGASSDIKGAILDFLKTFDSLTAGNHILNNMMGNLKNIAMRLPQSVSTQLVELMNQLIIPHENGNIAENASLLKNQIIPLLGNYISQTRDYGAAREIINMLILNLARYENGSKENFLHSFRSLMGYREISGKLGNIPQSDIEQFLMAAKTANKSNELINQFMQIISKGVSGEAGYQNKQIFQNILNAALINESVYMPLLHLMLPADINGNLFFSEMWVDPDHQGGEGEGDTEGYVKLLIKFDIKDLGFFEMIILAKGNQVDMELYYPERLESKQREIREGLQAIMQSNHLSFQNLMLDKCIEPKSISEVFPKIYEGRNVVNVTI